MPLELSPRFFAQCVHWALNDPFLPAPSLAHAVFFVARHWVWHCKMERAGWPTPSL